MSLSTVISICGSSERRRLKMGNYQMYVSEKPRDNPLQIKGAVLDLLARKLNCERYEVSFLFGQNDSDLRAEVMAIPDARTH